jgi:hypothetical protein
MSCICAYTDPGSVYPVLDPRRTPGSSPFGFGYYFYEDGVAILVEEDPSLTNCQMLVGLSVQPGMWNKEVLAWNYCLGTSVSSVAAGGQNTGPNYMLIQKAQCFSGANTLLLRKAKFLGIMTGMYTFQSTDLWNFWGGMKVTLDWQFDDQGSGVWGSGKTAIYPDTKYPDGTVVRALAGQQPGAEFVIFGGAKFRIDPANTLGLNLAAAQLMDPTELNLLPSAPIDGTLLREEGDPHVYVCYGRAKFWITDPATLAALGFNWGEVHVVPPGGGLANIPLMPRVGTLLRERNDPKVFFVKRDAGQAAKICWVTTPGVLDTLCLSWNNVHVVPDGSLSALSRGPDLT